MELTITPFLNKKQENEEHRILEEGYLELGEARGLGAGYCLGPSSRWVMSSLHSKHLHGGRPREGQ